MIRIRFHGRGGHGTKTASRIAGTAAFLAGYQSQDSPVYGAERRGAAVVAFTRIDDEPILERGMIEHPDLIVLADETLLDAADARVLAGQERASAVFVNTARKETLIDKHSISVPVAALDLTTLTLETLGQASALSAGLGAAAGRLIGAVSQQQIVSALREEFENLRIEPEVVDKNVRIAEQVYAALQPMTIREKPLPVTGATASVGYDSPLLSTPSVLDPGNALARQTGSWRVERPVIDLDLCTSCGLCFMLCPDGTVALDEEGYPVIDYDHCKGCMICRQICPVHAIEIEKETQAW